MGKGRKGRGPSHQHVDQMHRRVENLARDLRNMNMNQGGGSRANSRRSSRANSREPSRSNSKGRPRSNSRGPVRTYTQGRRSTPRPGKYAKESGDFSMPQVPLPFMDIFAISKSRQVYEKYGKDEGNFHFEETAGFEASIVGDGEIKARRYTAFQTNRSDGELPRAIVAQSVIARKKTQDIVSKKQDGTSGEVTTIPYDSYALDSENNTFLLYVHSVRTVKTGNETNAMDLDDAHQAIMKKEVRPETTDAVFDADIDAASTALKTRGCYLFYPISYTVLSKKQPGRGIPAHLTMFFPVEHKENVANNILHKDKLGIVKPKAYTNDGDYTLTTSVTTREDLLQKYKNYISCHSFCDECKFSSDMIKDIDGKIRTIMERHYLVKRTNQSTGPVQIVHSRRIKIGARMGEARKEHKIRNYAMSMVFQMPNKDDKFKNVICKLGRDVMLAIVHKAMDTKYQEGILNEIQVTTTREQKALKWNAKLSREYMIRMLHTCYRCYHYRIMNKMITTSRVFALKDPMFTWKQYFQNQGAIPHKEVWDKLVRERENPTSTLPPRIYLLPDESTDEDDDGAISDARKSRAGTVSRSGSEPPPDPASYE